VAMVERAHQFRREVASRRASRADINTYVWDRLYCSLTYARSRLVT
jgi:hypothetical protein